MVDQPLDEEALRLNFFTFTGRLIKKMAEQGLDPNKPLDVAKFVNPITSTQTAKDIVIAAINRYQEIQRELERARQRDPNNAEAVAQSIRNATIGLGTQIEGALGEGVTAFEPILIPAMKDLGKYFSDLGVDIRKASLGDKEAQARLETTAGKAALAAPLAMLAKGVVGQAIAAVSTPLGVAAGIAGAAAPGASPTGAGRCRPQHRGAGPAGCGCGAARGRRSRRPDRQAAAGAGAYRHRDCRCRRARRQQGCHQGKDRHPVSLGQGA